MSRVGDLIDQLRHRQRGADGGGEEVADLGTPPQVSIRAPTPSDRDEFIALMQASKSLHHPWIFPPTTAGAFDEYLRRVNRDDHAGFLICERIHGRIAGVINLNNIVRGAFLSASLGYYAGKPLAGMGYMQAGLLLVARHAFSDLRLHRLEANIQPDNARSKSLVMRCGFTFEGTSPQFLYIDGAWRDHEHWALIDQRPDLY